MILPGDWHAPTPQLPSPPEEHGRVRRQKAPPSSTRCCCRCY